MLSSILESLRQEYRTRRMGRFAFWSAAYGAALWLVDRFTGAAPGFLWVLFWATFLPATLYYVVRLVRFFRERVLWRLRRRLVVTYLFMAVVPIVLILLLVAVGAVIINGQFAAFLVASNLRNHFDELRQLNRVVAHESHLTPGKNPEALLNHLRMLYVTELAEHAASYPGLEITLRLGPLVRAYRIDGTPTKPVAIPEWLKQEEFAGVVMGNGQLELRASDQAQTSVGRLTVILSQPLTPELLDLVGEGIGPVGVFVPQERGTRPPLPPADPGSPARLAAPEGQPMETINISSKSLRLPPPVNWLDRAVFGAAALNPVIWNAQKEEHFPVPVLLYASSRAVTLNRQLLATLGELSRVPVTFFSAVAVVFLAIEAFALIIGVQLTRSMTTTVDQLYQATERVKTGDFSYRISLPGRDQLSALGEAFDSMTASVERLLRESEEKSRLESELEIAREVQTRLFPQRLPEAPGLELYGICKPARVVSGDYYDFLQLGGKRIGLVLGDISGKGISAALLMATIQSALHAQFYDGFSATSVSHGIPVPVSTADVIARLNRQLFDSTPREKYATFFYAVYDGESRKLTYTNAGHLPPFLFRSNKVERLTVGGTVVGLFKGVSYEQSVIQIEPGDTILAFTDGVTEPENSYGEEFGEARLLEATRRALSLPAAVLVEEVCRSVTDWTSGPELQDDMTLMVARTIR